MKNAMTGTRDEGQAGQSNSVISCQTILSFLVSGVSGSLLPVSSLSPCLSIMRLQSDRPASAILTEQALWLAGFGAKAGVLPCCGGGMSLADSSGGRIARPVAATPNRRPA
jgi:hypothetical protein